MSSRRRLIENLTRIQNEKPFSNNQNTPIAIATRKLLNKLTRKAKPTKSAMAKRRTSRLSQEKQKRNQRFTLRRSIEKKNKKKNKKRNTN